MKFVITSGSVVSGLGKGITASSIGVLLQNLGINVTAIKIDPYLNVDASMLAPKEHGEVYVLGTSGANENDSVEVDLDFGSYERFLDISLTGQHSITSGKIYRKVIDAERAGSYLGQTVQVIPHFTDAVQEQILKAARIPVSKNDKPPDVCIIELGGTVGDIESMPFVEALRQLQNHVEVEAVCNLHVTLLPTVNGEVKTKPAQNAVSMMRSSGLCPDIIVCRHDLTDDIGDSTYSKLSKMCGLPRENVITMATEKILWKVPLVLESKGVSGILSRQLNLQCESRGTKLEVWRRCLVNRLTNTRSTITIALVGKYVQNADAYLSVTRALQHSALYNGSWVQLKLIDADAVKVETIDTLFEKVDGIIVPGGFGERGAEGLILTCSYARAHRKPFLGICLGFQMAVIEYARTVVGISDATSQEFSEVGSPVVIHLPDYTELITGGTLRLGSHVTLLNIENSLARHLYDGEVEISERHRHRYEINPSFIGDLRENGLIFSGTDQSGVRMEIFELSSRFHPFYMGCQFHPEFQSRPLRPAPLFNGFIDACLECQ